MKDAFCRLFGSLTVHRLLLGLSPDYAQLPVNIFEPVLIAALGLVMVERLPSGLDLTTYDILLLEDTFESKTKEQIESALCTALNRVIKVFWGMNFQQISSHNMVNWGQELGAGTGG